MIKKELTKEEKKKINSLRNKSMSVAAILATLLIISPWEGSVKNKEGMHVVYRDAVGIPTACAGLTGKDYLGQPFKIGNTYSDSECDYMTSVRVQGFEEDVVMAVVPFNSVRVTVDNRFISEYQKAALISFSYNVGITAFRNSTLLKMLNSGNHEGACEQLSRWVHAGGKKLRGLVSRRADEREWCLGNAPWKAEATMAYLNENNGD